MRDDARLAGAGAREDQKRPIGMKNGLLLLGIEACEEIQAFIVSSSCG
jgi:hypothetical protein